MADQIHASHVVICSHVIKVHQLQEPQQIAGYECY